MVYGVLVTLPAWRVLTAYIFSVINLRVFETRHRSDIYETCKKAEGIRESGAEVAGENLCKQCAIYVSYLSINVKKVTNRRRSASVYSQDNVEASFSAFLLSIMVIITVSPLRAKGS